MNKYTRKLMLIAVLSFSLMACDDDNDSKAAEPTEPQRSWFISQTYLDNNSDLAPAGITPDKAWAHYVDFGRNEGRPPYVAEWQRELAVEAPVDNRARMIIDTDMSLQGDPDDVQCYIAQASTFPSLFNVRGIVSTGGNKTGGPYLGGVGGSDLPFINGVIRRLNEVSSKHYPKYNVVGGQDAINLYKAEFADTSSRLTIFIWGSVVNFSKAVQGLPEAQLKNADVYWVANWNRAAVAPYREAWDKLIPLVSKFGSFYRDEEGFRGIMRSGDVSKLEALHRDILASPVGAVYKRYPIPEPTFNWKAGDLSLFFYYRNKSFRDSLFKRDQYGGFVADGLVSEQAVASNGFRDAMVKAVKVNVNRK